MTPIETAEPVRLPLWRVILGIAVLGTFVAIIGFLTPVYWDDLLLHRYVVSLETAPNAATVPDETLRSEVVDRARALSLPVKSTDIRIAHTGSKPKIEMRYVVEINLVAYPVDLHFPTIR